MKSVCDLKHESERIFLQCLLVRLKPVADLGVRCADQSEVHVAGKAVLTEFVLLSINPVALLPYASDNREKHRRAASPICGIALPQIFSLTLADALELSSVVADRNSQHFILECMHNGYLDFKISYMAANVPGFILYATSAAKTACWAREKRAWASFCRSNVLAT